MITAHQALPLVALSINVVLFVAAQTQDRRDRLHAAFADFIGCLGMWTLGVFGLRTSGGEPTAMFWERLLPGEHPLRALLRHRHPALRVPRRARHGQAGRVLLYAVMVLVLVPVAVVIAVMEQLLFGDLSLFSLSTGAMFIVAFAVVLPAAPRLEAMLTGLVFRREEAVRAALLDLSRELSAMLDLQRLEGTLAEGLVHRIPLRHAAFYIRDASDNEFVCAATVTHETWADRLPEPDPILPQAVKIAQWFELTPRPLLVAKLPPHAGPGDLAELAARLERARVAVLVPLFVAHRLTAVLALGHKVTGEPFSSEELRLLEALMGQAATAFTNAQLYEDVQDRRDRVSETQEQLIQSAKLATIGQMATSIAHELNNPLTVMMTAASLLGRELPPGSPQQQRIELILAEGNRAAKITRDVLDVARRREVQRAYEEHLAGRRYAAGPARPSAVHFQHNESRHRRQLPDVEAVRRRLSDRSNPLAAVPHLAGGDGVQRVPACPVPGHRRALR